MSSLIPGYEYDIFISYRQKDNKHDGWVTEFVENLKGELESTFKEDISIYFDENPHDRLQETHDVDKSLEGKLKCLIFIPILSQTYCDPNSYAWQNEFLSFLQAVKNDHFGKDIKLRSGNVASRILPIRIHDLDPEDVKLFEKETGSVLRALDFVFKTSSGVNRPLKVNEDHPQDNLNKTYYSDQINKVAGAIKEIIQGIKVEPVTTEKAKAFPEESPEIIRPIGIKREPEKQLITSKKKILYGVLITALLAVMAILAYPKILKKDSLERYREEGTISVAVMPFQNLTSDADKSFWQEMIQDNLITSLSNSEELKVRQTESIKTLLQENELTNYASITSSVASRISQKLDANIFVQGSISQTGSIVRLNSKLVDSKTEEVFRSFQIDGTAENILQTSDSLSRLIRDFLLISVLKKEVPQSVQKIITTNYPEAFRNFIQGMNSFYSLDYATAKTKLLRALDIDSTFTAAMFYLSVTYGSQEMYEQAKKWCLRAFEKRDKMSLHLKSYTNWGYARLFQTPYEEIKYMRELLKADDQAPFAHYEVGQNYIQLNQYEKQYLK